MSVSSAGIPYGITQQNEIYRCAFSNTDELIMKPNILTHVSNDRDLIRLWLGGKSPTTQVSYLSTVKGFFGFIDQPLSDVTLEDLQMWQRRLELTFKPSTIQNKVLVIKSLFSYAVKVGYLTVNVGSFIKAPKVKDTLSEKILTADDCKKLIAAARSGRDRALLSLMYACGLRVGEVCGLTWSDLRDGKATVFGKGAKTRIVIVPEVVWEQLMALPRTHEAVFISRRGNRLERTYVHRMIKDCCQRSGVSQKASSHWLRHSHASHAIEGGCNLRLLQQSLGHSKLETTEKYLHVNPDEGSSQFIDL